MSPSSSSKYTPQDAAMQMPNVFVVPPEEDETPAWCFFDADNPALSQVIERPETSDTSLFNLTETGAYPPIYDDNVDDMDATIMPRRNIENISVVDALIADDYQGEDDIDSDTESDYEREILEGDPHSIRESARQLPRDMRNVADDSDVIEVVKVSRRTGMPDGLDRENMGTRFGAKRSATLRSRASKVFRSLKGTLRSSKPRAQDIFPPPLPTSAVPLPSSSQQTETGVRPRSPTVSRRGSRTLSQLFTAPSLKSQSSMASLDDRPPMSPTDSSSVTSPTSSTHVPSKPISRRTSLYTVFGQDEARLRATSPTPTTSSAKSATRRFSMLTLQKLFSFPSASSTATTSSIPPEDSGRATPTLRSTTSTPASVMSSVLTSGPQTPTSTEEVNSVRLVSPKDTTDPPVFESFESVFDAHVGSNLGLGLGLNLNSEPTSNPMETPRKSRSNSLKQAWGSVTPKGFGKGPPAPIQAPDLDEDGDMSLEMRLDSFHFDSLSFDADQFIVT